MNLIEVCKYWVIILMVGIAFLYFYHEKRNRFKKRHAQGVMIKLVLLDREILQFIQLMDTYLIDFSMLNWQMIKETTLTLKLFRYKTSRKYVLLDII